MTRQMFLSDENTTTSQAFLSFLTDRILKVFEEVLFTRMILINL